MQKAVYASSEIPHPTQPMKKGDEIAFTYSRSEERYIIVYCNDLTVSMNRVPREVEHEETDTTMDRSDLDFMIRQGKAILKENLEIVK